MQGGDGGVDVDYGYRIDNVERAPNPLEEPIDAKLTELIRGQVDVAYWRATRKMPSEMTAQERVRLEDKIWSRKDFGTEGMLAALAVLAEQQPTVTAAANIPALEKENAIGYGQLRALLMSLKARTDAWKQRGDTSAIMGIKLSTRNQLYEVLDQ